jgi:hypothetical protein
LQIIMSTPRLDHIIVLVPYASLVSLPSYLTINFTITPGGRHSDNKTENKLICFQDGSYIELIAFINDDPKLREGHWWGKAKFGIIDFAFTHADGNALFHFSELEKRLGGLELGDHVGKVGYQAPVDGGRKRPDGVEIRWQVTFPIVGAGEKGYQRGELPFWCHDITPREERVPVEKKNVEHPCGSTGVSELCIYVPEERAAALLEAYEAILGGPAKLRSFEVKNLKAVGGSRDVSSFVIATPVEDWQKQAMEERGGCLLANLNLSSKGGKQWDQAVGIGKEFGVGGLMI